MQCQPDPNLTEPTMIAGQQLTALSAGSKARILGFAPDISIDRKTQLQACRTGTFRKAMLSLTANASMLVAMDKTTKTRPVVNDLSAWVDDMQRRGLTANTIRQRAYLGMCWKKYIGA